jgi:hypothetical protein
MSGRRAARRKRTTGELLGTHSSSCGEPVIFVASIRTGARSGHCPRRTTRGRRPLAACTRGGRHIT